MLAVVIITAAACSHTDELHFSTIEEEAALSISVLAEQPTRGMITDSMLPDGSELCIGIFNPDGSNYMGKTMLISTLKLRMAPGHRYGNRQARSFLVKAKVSYMPIIRIRCILGVTYVIFLSRLIVTHRMTSCTQDHTQG